MSNHFRSRGGEQSGRQAGQWEDDDDSSRDIRRARGGGSTSTSSSGGSGSGGGGFGGGRADRGIGHQKFKGQLQLQHNVPPFLQKMMSQNGGAASGLGVSLEGMLSAKTQAAGEGKKRPRHGDEGPVIANLDDFRARDVDLIVDEDGNITEKERAEVKTDRKDTHTVVSKLDPDKDAGTHSVHMTDEQIERERLLNMSEEYRKQKREEAEHEAKKRKRENTPELDNLEEQTGKHIFRKGVVEEREKNTGKKEKKKEKKQQEMLSFDYGDE